ncbi:MAG: 2Fe-2S iron-sulfur cluster-binding protein [Alphaproteobacteria bacterium]
MSIHVIDRHGDEHRLPALAGWRVMEVIRDWGLDIKAECGGACACATCHVYVDRDWSAIIPAVTDEEENRLDDAFSVEDGSRLSCQLIMTEAMDGLKVTLAPGIGK